MKETLRQLQKGSKEIFLPRDPQVLAKALDRLSDNELLQAPDVEAVVMERLRRKGIDVNSRSSALDQLAKLHNTDRVSEAITALRRLDSAAAAPSAAADLGLLLTATPASDLAKSRASLSNLADSARQSPVRRAAYAALVAADGRPDTVWAATAQHPETRATLIDSVILLADPISRTAFEPLLTGALADATTPANVRSAALSALPLMGPDNAGKNFGILAAHCAMARPHRRRRAVTRYRAMRGTGLAARLPSHSRVGQDRARRQTHRQDYVETVQVGTNGRAAAGRPIHPHPQGTHRPECSRLRSQERPRADALRHDAPGGRSRQAVRNHL